MDISDLPMKKGIITNRNKFILGPSGSGKSFFTNHLIRQYYEQGTHVLLVDTGNSYQGLCELVRQKTGGKDGVYFTYTEENPIAFNPFYTDDGVFDIEKSGVLVTESLLDDPLYDSITTQAGLQRHKGFELSAQGAVTDTLFIMASTMYLDAIYERDSNYEGKQPVDAPKWSASLWSRYEVTELLALNAGLLFQGERFANADNTVLKDSYYRLDLGATYSTKIGKYDTDFRLNIENALDENYLAGGGINNVTVGDSRAARFEIRVSM